MKRAILIGCNYTGSTAQLSGCVNDTLNLKELIIKHFDYQEDNIQIMIDNSPGGYVPNRDNIISQLESLVLDINQGGITEAWISFSGHGSYLRDRNGDERDGKDECLVPLDYRTAGFITDDILYSILTKITNQDCRLVCQFDCCHSGTILDLKYSYNTEYHPPRVSNIVKRVRERARRRIRVGWRWRWMTGWVWKNRVSQEHHPEKWVWGSNIENTSSKNIECQVIMISGCLDAQTSLDVFHPEKGEWNGALTSSFIKSISECSSFLDFLSLGKELNTYMIQHKYTQRPLISSNFQISGDNIFFKKKNLDIFVMN